LRWFRRLRRQRDVDPGTPHQFRQIDDDGMAALAAGGAYGSAGEFGGLTQLAATDNYIRKSRCGVPGCGRERGDPIHQGGGT
jgi:hypothetical protein